MRAVVFRNGDLVVDDVETPKPGAGQVLVKTLNCGICASDVHCLHHAEDMMAAARRAGSNFNMDLTRDIVFGHEFAAEVLEYGPQTERKFKTGTRVSSIPIAINFVGEQAQVHPLGFSNELPGGFAQYMLLSEMLLTEIPNGLSAPRAALTEPMAVGIHAVERANLTPKDLPLVVGCGPVGLAVIAALKLKGAEPIVAADFSVARRKLAKEMGAHIVVDPGQDSPYKAWSEAATPEGFDPKSLAAALGMPPQPRPAIIFECVGAPGVIQQIIQGAPKEARIVVVGVCMTPDTIEPFGALEKQLNVQFVIGETPDEFARAMRHIAEGEINVDPLITDAVGLADVGRAFAALGDIERNTKILVEPWH